MWYNETVKIEGDLMLEEIKEVLIKEKKDELERKKKIDNEIKKNIIRNRWKR